MEVYLQNHKNLFTNNSQILNITNQNENVAKLNKTAFISNLILMILGALDNFMAFCTFLQKDLRKRKFNWYLLTITIFEIFFCCTGFIDYIFLKIYDQNIFLHDLNKISYITVDYILHTSDSCVVVLTLLLSIDRLYAIKHPLKIKEFITNLHAKKTIFISLLSLVSLKTLSFVLCELNLGNKRFILYCSLVSPLLFNTLPLVLIFVINGLLAKEMWSYNEQLINNECSTLNVNTICDDTIASVSNYRRSTQIVFNKNKSTVTLRKSGKCALSKIQKSHYIVIFVSSIWSILSSIPYYSFNSYFLLFQLNFFSNNFDLKNMIMIHIISSVLFNANHCINFFIYFIFYSEFRNIILNFFLFKPNS